MLDIKFIREHVAEIKKAIQQKKIQLNLDDLLVLDQEKVKQQQQIEELQRQRNAHAEKLKNTGGKPDMDAITEGKRLKETIAELEKKLSDVEKQFINLMVKVPTIPSPDTPEGKDDSENIEIERYGTPRTFDFPIKDHIQLGKDLDILDLERGTKVAGYRGYYVKNEGVQLMMAYIMYALNKMIGKGFTPMLTPTLIKQFGLFGSGYLKGTEYDPEIDEIYQVASHDKEEDGMASKDKKFLIGTAEPALLAYYADEVLTEEQLPIKLVGFSQCYRSEIGSYGKDTKGFYRVHEFMKVEQVVLCKADVEESNKWHKNMLNYTKELYDDFKIPYRVLSICTGDMSAGKYKAFDIDAWMPSRDGWGEVGSASNFLDWQSRRLNVRYTTTQGEKKYVHMLNNTVIPTPRPFIAILENYQNADGSVTIPEVLRPYMGGKERIERK